MNGRTGSLLAIAVACGLAAMYGTRQLMVRQPKAEQTREVLAATRDLKVEEVLKPDMVKVVKVPESGVPVGSFNSYKDIADRWVRMPMLAGETIVDAKLAPKDAPVGLLSRIPDGMRAFAIEVNEQTGVSGFVLPDHRVDVVLSRQGNTQGRPQSETILQDVMVLAAGTATTRPEDKAIQARTVTLAVTPDQVDRLVAACVEGTLTLSLRGLNDHEQVPTEPKSAPVETRPVIVAASDLLAGAEIEAPMLKTEAVPKAALLPADHFATADQLLGRKVRTALKAGEPVVESKLVGPDDLETKVAEAPEPEPALSAFDIAPNMRAVPIKVADLAGGSSHARKGDWVDVIYMPTRADLTAGPTGADASEPLDGAGATAKAPIPATPAAAPTAPLQTAAETILHCARVLSSPWDAHASTGVTDLLVLEAPAYDAPRLIHAQATGKITLVLRHPEDDGYFVAQPPPVVVIHHGAHRKGERQQLQLGAPTLERRVANRPAAPRRPQTGGLLSSRDATTSTGK